MKLIVCDFDGTYFVDSNNILINNQYINNFRKQGNLFMLSSGRSYKSLLEMTKTYHIEFDYLSCCDGSILYDNKGNILIKFELNNSILKKFLSLKKYAKIERIQYSYQDDYYKAIQEDYLIGCNLVLENKEITKKFLTEFYKLQKEYPDYDFLKYTHDEITYFCLKNKGINKSSTVNYLEKNLNLDYQDIYVFGDNENDYPMLSCYQSYCIGNVSEKLKQVAIKSYNQVYEFLKEKQF